MPVDAQTVANLGIRAGLLTPSQADEGFHEAGGRGGDAETFLAALQRKGYLTPWQTAKLFKEEKDGYFLGGYRILYKIASGSFGRVYRADDPHTGRIVAIKILRKKWSEDKHNIELFEREGQVGMTLKHPNIVEILAVNRDPATKQYFLVMEFVEGGNLRDFLTIRKKLDGPEVLRILEEVATALNYALSRGLTHRDMKLTNILLSSSGACKLVDFGLAHLHHTKVMVDKDDFTVDRTVDYAGLEKATNVSSGDTRSDLYFLGCVGYELLTGRSPLDMTRNPRARMAKERFTTIPPIKPEETSASPAVIRLLETMMSLNPQERFQTPSQALDAIREARREVDGKAKGAQVASATGQKTLFFIEKDERLKDILREKFKEQGYRVLLATDPARALERFRQQPFEVLIVDVGTTGDNGLLTFERIMADFWKKNINSKETFIDEAYEGKVVYQDTSAKFRSKVELVHKKPEDYMLKKSKKGVNVLEKVEEKYEGVGQVGLLAMYSTDNGKFLIDLAKNYKGRLIEIGLFLGPSHSVGLDTTNSPTSIVFFDPACGEMETSCEDFCAMVKATWQWWGYKDYTATFYRPVG